MAVSPAIRGTFAITFLALSIAGLYTFRIMPMSRGAPLNFDTIIANKQLNVPFQYVKIPQRYTGLGPVDEFLGMLVTAFSYGVLRLDEDSYWQQLHFLIGFIGFIGVMTVEAYRPRNSGALLSYTSVVALLYQTIGGAFIIPLYALLYVYATSDAKYLRVGRSIHLYTAKAFLPALLVGYLLPTILVYIPRESYVTSLYFNAIWQFAPIYVNALMGNFSGLINAFTSNKNVTPTSDVFYLRATYFVCILASFAIHVTTIAAVVMGNPREITLSSVFIPSLDQLGKSPQQDLHFMFQVDWIFCGATALLLGLFAVLEVSAQQASLGIKSDTGRVAAIILLYTVLTGPGGALAAIWWWRENALIEIEGKVGKKAIEKKN